MLVCTERLAKALVLVLHVMSVTLCVLMCSLWLTQDCDGYDDDMGPLVIDTAPMSPERGPLKADRKKHEHSEVHEPLHDLDINQQDSLNQHAGYFDESTSQNDALNSTTGTLGSVSWSSSALSPSDLPKNKNGGRLISPSKTRRKSDKVGIVCVLIFHTTCKMYKEHVGI